MDLYKTNIDQMEAVAPSEKQDAAIERVEMAAISSERAVNPENVNQLTRPNIEQVINPRDQAPIVPVSNVIRDPISVASRYTNVSAEDNDVIERQWIDGVKKTIADTKNQPMRRNSELEETKKIYQQKRRGF